MLSYFSESYLIGEFALVVAWQMKIDFVISIFL